LNKLSNTLLLGDDTWEKLYNFKLAITCKSFKVSDFHTCDQVIRDNLLELYKKREYQFIVGHFLGIDHIGHTLSSVIGT
jgi:phosphatidylinositol glycan class O